MCSYPCIRLLTATSNHRQLGIGVCWSICVCPSVCSYPCFQLLTAKSNHRQLGIGVCALEYMCLSICVFLSYQGIGSCVCVCMCVGDGTGLRARGFPDLSGKILCTSFNQNISILLICMKNVFIFYTLFINLPASSQSLFETITCMLIMYMYQLGSIRGLHDKFLKQKTMLPALGKLYTGWARRLILQL